MPHLFIAYDNQDVQRGEYFTRSQQHLIDNVSNFCKVQQFDNKRIVNDSLVNAISELNAVSNTPFIFVSYTHGSEAALQIDNTDFIHQSNVYLFGETLFYACSCLSGQLLKDYLIQNNCKFFMGYNQTITTLYPDTEPIFIHCENAALIHFLTSDCNLLDAISYMYDEYENMKLETDSKTAAILDKNLDAFVFEGDRLLTKIDFMRVSA